MATPVQNPYDTQQPKPPAPAPAAQGIVAGAMPAAPAAYKPVTRSVDQKSTVQGQVNSILASDGPLMQRARSLALEQMNQRGLINSSMAVGAAQAAMMDRALPIAQQDAGTFDQAARDNQGFANQAGQFNAGARNQFGLQGNEMAFQREQRSADRQFQTGEREATQGFQAEQQRLQNEQQSKVLAQQHAQQLEQMGYANKLATANVPAQFASTISATTLDRVNAIMADPNLDPAAKKTAVENVVNYANSTISWAEKFYAATMPRLTVPGAPPPSAPAPAPKPSAPAPAPAPTYQTMANNVMQEFGA